LFEKVLQIADSYLPHISICNMEEKQAIIRFNKQKTLKQQSMAFLIPEYRQSTHIKRTLVRIVSFGRLQVYLND
jgi:hypothetical protein